MRIKVVVKESKNEFGFPTDGKIEMVKYLDGLINYGGRSLPF